MDTSNLAYLNTHSPHDPVMNLTLTPLKKNETVSHDNFGALLSEKDLIESTIKCLNNQPTQFLLKENAPMSTKTTPESSGQDSPQGHHQLADPRAKPILLFPPKRTQSLKVPSKQYIHNGRTEAIKSMKEIHDVSQMNDPATEAKIRARFLKAEAVVTQQRSKPTGRKYNGTAFSEKHPKTASQSKSSSLSKKQNLKSKEIFPDVNKEKKGEQTLGVAVNPSSGNVSPQSSESERGHRRTDSSSGQSVPDRGDTSRMSGKRPELPPKPTFIHNVLSAGREFSKAPTTWISKSKQVTSIPDALGTLNLESSSGSEPEATLPAKRVTQGRRNLRKTKSRGKGKGNEDGISSSMVLAADFASSGHSGGSDFDIILHPVPSGIDLEDTTAI